MHHLAGRAVHDCERRIIEMRFGNVVTSSSLTQHATSTISARVIIRPDYTWHSIEQNSHLVWLFHWNRKNVATIEWAALPRSVLQIRHQRRKLRAAGRVHSRRHSRESLWRGVQVYGETFCAVRAETRCEKRPKRSISAWGLLQQVHARNQTKSVGRMLQERIERVRRRQHSWSARKKQFELLLRGESFHCWHMWEIIGVTRLFRSNQRPAWT